MANAHEGISDRCRRLVDAAADAGADAVKFQKLPATSSSCPRTEYQHFCDLEMKTAMGGAHRPRALARAAVLADVFGGESATLMHELRIDGYKIHRPTRSMSRSCSRWHGTARRSS